MSTSRSLSALVLGTALLLAAPTLAGAGHDKSKGKGKAYGKHSAVVHVPPGLAKKGGLPPGLAKKLARPLPSRLYVAFDPRRDDRAWFLLDDRWVLHRGFDAPLRLELRGLLDLPHVRVTPIPPPLPRLHVVFFG